MIGSTISHYKIIEKLGGGGMGEVYLAEDFKLKRKIALKFLPAHISGEADKTRFLHEAQAAAALNHPNVCTIYEIQDQVEKSFIAMEYINGQTLKERILDDKLTFDQVIDYAIQIADALKDAHDKGIIHRDIKSDNIMVTTRNQIKVMDFGLAKLKGSFKITKKVSTVGTLVYMAPEQIEGKEVDPRSDIFSFGIVLYEMLTGRLPFKGDYEAAVMYSILNEEPEPVQKHTPDISSELMHTINRSLEKDPKNRYQSMNDLIIDLRRLKKESPIKSYQSQTVKNKNPYLNRKRLTTFSIVLISISLIIIVGYFMIDQIVQTEESDFTSTIESPWENSIAVLPFVDMSPNKDQEYFCDGIAEEIINKLSSIKSLKVIARTSSFQFKGKLIDASEIGKKLNVINILEGSVRKSNNMVRITAQLINAEDGSHLWSKTFEKELKNIFSIQDEIALSVLDKIKLGMIGEDNLIRVGTNNTDAYEAYLQGQFFFQKFSPDDQQKAIEYYNKSIEIDPLFAKAYAGLADVYNNLSMSGVNTPLENIPKAREMVSKALELDPDLSEAYVILADIKHTYERDKKEAEELFKKSIQLNPGSAIAHSYFGMFLMSLTRYDEALLEVKKSLKLDPLSFTLNMNGYYLSLFAKDEEFKKQITQKLLILNPDSSAIKHSFSN